MNTHSNHAANQTDARSISVKELKLLSKELGREFERIVPDSMYPAEHYSATFAQALTRHEPAHGFLGMQLGNALDALPDTFGDLRKMGDQIVTHIIRENDVPAELRPALHQAFETVVNEIAKNRSNYLG